jgi:hypothetical protein
VSANIYFVMVTVSITTNRYAIVRDNRFDRQIDCSPCGTVASFLYNKRPLFVLYVKTRQINVNDVLQFTLIFARTTPYLNRGVVYADRKGAKYVYYDA